MREGVIINPIEIAFYSQSKRYHEFQKSAICFAFSRYFGGVENIIGGCRKEDWIRLIIILMKSMEKLGLDYLAHFVSANRTQFLYKRMGKELETMITSDPLYQEIVDKKYCFIQGLFEKKNFIKQTINSILNNTYTYNTYGSSRNGELIEKDNRLIVQQVIQFFNSFVM
jgi:hypothetical protein